MLCTYGRRHFLSAALCKWKNKRRNLQCHYESQNIKAFQNWFALNVIVKWNIFRLPLCSIKVSLSTIRAIFLASCLHHRIREGHLSDVVTQSSGCSEKLAETETCANTGHTLTVQFNRDTWTTAHLCRYLISQSYSTRSYRNRSRASALTCGKWFFLMWHHR